MDAFAPRRAAPPGAGSANASLASVEMETAARGPSDAVAGGGAPGEALVGSSGARTYHRASCRHAARIKPENTIRFATPADAARAGRKPCRTCKPDAP